MNRAPTGYRLLAVLPLLAAASALGQDGDEEAAFDRTPEDCVIVSRIDQTDAIDDQNIIFRMRGDRVYRNTLPRKCPGLARENRIAYSTVASRLCSIDTITVLEDLGVGLRPGFTCRLGEFVPLSEAEVEDIDLRKKGEAGQRAIETTSVELEKDDAESDEAEAGDAPTGRDGESAAEDEPATTRDGGSAANEGSDLRPPGPAEPPQ
ncbi:MAG TPA: DUF6491 family protein [Gammaproteobacteria bacterium]|nr:DUF6491 family protein [Gammaproteobacteria bacterium]